MRFTTFVFYAIRITSGNHKVIKKKFIVLMN